MSDQSNPQSNLNSDQPTKDDSLGMTLSALIGATPEKAKEWFEKMVAEGQTALLLSVWKNIHDESVANSEKLQELESVSRLSVANDQLGHLMGDVEHTLRLFRNLPENWGSNQTPESLADVLGPLNAIRKEVDKIEKTVKVVIKAVIPGFDDKMKASETITLRGERYTVKIEPTTTERFSKEYAFEQGILTPEQYEAGKQVSYGSRMTIV